MRACLSCNNKYALNNEVTPMIIKDNVSMHQNTKDKEIYYPSSVTRGEYFCANRHLYSRQHSLFDFLAHFFFQKTGLP